ncbi:MAG: HupE/UreJ family protein [Pedosphaera sp.]|nr:HupE/UreJ family protein [Pedosphaera sp.]
MPRNGTCRQLAPVVLGLLCLFVTVGTALAHKTSDSYLGLTVERGKITGRWDIALSDLQEAIGFDDNGDGTVTWTELKAREHLIAPYAFSNLTIRAANTIATPRHKSLDYEAHESGAYIILRFDLEGVIQPDQLTLHYELFFKHDPLHRGLFRLAAIELGQAEPRIQTAIFSPFTPLQKFLIREPSAWRQFANFGREGAWHIWIGFDHVLFLIALLLPAVLRRERGQWRSVGEFRPALWEVLKIVTAFTVAHSITLALAALEIVRLPSRWVETAIAASVALAALNNLRPFFEKRGWWVAFGFGLVHGFGFASALGDLELGRDSLAWTLASFNLGVELGQLAIVLVFLPFAFALRHSWFYQRLIFQGGSVCVVLIAVTLTVQRCFDLKLLPF